MGSKVAMANVDFEFVSKGVVDKFYRKKLYVSELGDITSD
jgi:hypothetical protein